MARPEPGEAPADGADKASASPPSGSPHQPDWLVGADEGVEGELLRSRRAAESTEPMELERPTPRLVRPEADESWNQLPEKLRDRTASPDKPEKPAKPVAWAAAGNSVPRLSHDAMRRPRVETQVEDEDPVEDEELRFPGPGADDDRVSVPRAAIKPPEEPFYMVALEELATNRLLQMGITAGCVLVLALWAFWPRERGASVAQIKRTPATFEGQAVRIHGRVGEVFSMGQGYVFNLHQGRDTVVVFSRVRVPKPREKVQVTGTVSTGYLDGVPRVALFETPR